MISNDTLVTIEKFTTIVKRSAQARSKDIRIEMTDATALVAELANVMARLAFYENSAVKDSSNITVSMDGGGFRSKI